MNILLIYPSVSDKQKFGRLTMLGSTSPPLNLLYLGSSLKASGHTVKIVDADAGDYRLSDILSIIKSFNPDVVGISSVTLTASAASDTAAKIKEYDPGITVVLGGHHVTVLPLETMENCTAFDYAFTGEAENVFCDFAKLFEKEDIASIKKLPGLLYREGKTVIHNPGDNIIENLDILPMPEFGLIDGFFTKYRKAAHNTFVPEPTAYLLISRGCCYTCNFCSRKVSGTRARYYSVDYSINLLKHVKTAHGVKGVIFGDELLISDRKYAEKLFRRMIDEGLNDIKWACRSHINNIDEDIVSLMKKAGCIQIYFGLESGSRAILHNLNKNIDPGKVYEKLKMMRKHGISSTSSFMLGCPGETEETMKETINFAKNSPMDYVFVCCFTPMPGTKIYDEYTRWGKMDPDYSRMSQSEYVFIPHGLSKEQLEHYESRLYRSFYLRPERILRQFALMNNRSAIKATLAGIRHLLFTLK
ncbi:MAG: cobalamin-dependent protein [Elusimicrobia bacterium]|nr:cobalamin-dependent protein [Elusimicrobiota bacterium]